MDQPFAELGEMNTFLSGGAPGERDIMRVLAGFAVGAAIVAIIALFVYIIISVFGSSGFASFRQKRSKQSTAYKVQPHRQMEPMHAFAIESENAHLSPSMARPEMMMDYDPNRMSFDNFAGFTGDGPYDQMPQYQEGLMPNQRIPNMPNEYTANNSTPMLENILYER
jgi:hypothetical protein